MLRNPDIVIFGTCVELLVSIHRSGLLSRIALLVMICNSPRLVDPWECVVFVDPALYYVNWENLAKIHEWSKIF